MKEYSFTHFLAQMKTHDWAEIAAGPYGGYYLECKICGAWAVKMDDTYFMPETYNDLNCNECIIKDILK